MDESELIHLDCTLRDGGYYNAWDFSRDLIDDYLQSMHALEVDYVELGFRSLDGSSFKGGCAFTTERFISRLAVPEGLKLGVMVNASEIVGHPGGVVGALACLFGPARASRVALVRIACHADRIEVVLPGCEWLKDHGYRVGLNVMQIATLVPAEIIAAARIIAKCPAVDVLYFADSLGSMGGQIKPLKSLRPYESAGIALSVFTPMTIWANPSPIRYELLRMV